MVSRFEEIRTQQLVEKETTRELLFIVNHPDKYQSRYVKFSIQELEKRKGKVFITPMDKVC